MPNWTTNIIKCKIENLLKFLTITPEGKWSFDFNKLIPMPKELDLESGTEEYDAIACYFLAVDEQEKVHIKQILSSRSLFRGVSRTYMDEYLEIIRLLNCRDKYDGEYPEELVELGKKCVSNIDKYGHPTWWEWTRENWGTKWNVGTEVDVSINEYIEACVSFETAWCVPMGIVKKYAELCTDDEFHWEYRNEDPDFWTIHILKKVHGEIIETCETYDEEYANDGEDEELFADLEEEEA